MSRLVTWPQAIDQIKSSKDVPISILRFKQLLIEPRVLQGKCIINPTWNDGLVVYGTPNQPLGDVISFRGFEVKIPKDYQTLSDAALMLPTFANDGTRNFHREGYALIVTNEQEFKLTKDFPPIEGWYAIDSKTGLQYGKIISKFDENGNPSPEASWLDRIAGGYVGWGQRDSSKIICSDGRTYSLIADAHYTMANLMTEKDAIELTK